MKKDYIEIELEHENRDPIEVSLYSSRKSLDVEFLGVPSASSRDYNALMNKPSIETVTLQGDKTFEQLGLKPLNADDLLEILV